MSIVTSNPLPSIHLYIGLAEENEKCILMLVDSGASTNLERKIRHTASGLCRNFPVW